MQEACLQKLDEVTVEQRSTQLPHIPCIALTKLLACTADLGLSVCQHHNAPCDCKYLRAQGLRRRTTDNGAHHQQRNILLENEAAHRMVQPAAAMKQQQRPVKLMSHQRLISHQRPFVLEVWEHPGGCIDPPSTAVMLYCMNIMQMGVQQGRRSILTRLYSPGLLEIAVMTVWRVFQRPTQEQSTSPQRRLKVWQSAWLC